MGSPGGGLGGVTAGAVSVAGSVTEPEAAASAVPAASHASKECAAADSGAP